MPQLTAFRGFDAKCPACFLLEIEGRRLLFDLGAGPNAAGWDRPDRRRSDSHGHADHVGSLLMRHGETEANARDMICGRTDLALTPRGLDQARQAADALRGSGIEVVLTSPLMRARQTAETIAGMLGLAPINIAGLAERNWGAWEGAPQATLRRDDTPPGGEAPVIFHDRIARAFRALDLAGSTLIVAHSGTAREIRRLLPPAEHDRMQNGEIRRWICAGGRWTCHEFFKPAP